VRESTKQTNTIEICLQTLDLRMGLRVAKLTSFPAASKTSAGQEQHNIDIPLTDSKIDMERECPDGNCVIGKTEQFLAVMKGPRLTRQPSRKR